MGTVLVAIVILRHQQAPQLETLQQVPRLPQLETLQQVPRLPRPEALQAHQQVVHHTHRLTRPHLQLALMTRAGIRMTQLQRTVYGSERRKTSAVPNEAILQMAWFQQAQRVKQVATPVLHRLLSRHLCQLPAANQILLPGTSGETQTRIANGFQRDLRSGVPLVPRRLMEYGEISRKQNAELHAVIINRF